MTVEKYVVETKEKKAKSDKCAKCTNLFSKIVQITNQWMPGHTNTFSDQHLFCVFSDQKSKQMLQEGTHLHFFLCDFIDHKIISFPLNSQK